MEIAMKRFMILLYEDESVYRELSPEELQKEIELHLKWIEELGDHYMSSEPLERDAKVVKGEAPVITDGPFMEAKEVITGFYLIRAENLDQAAKLAHGCPILKFGGSVEVRTIMEME
jgi:hypothetical protein